MSNNDIIRENNKKLFESRLQMKPNSSLKINQISINTNKSKIRNKTNLYLFNTDIFSGDISQNKRKIQSGIENSLNNFVKKNTSIEKKSRKINKNRNKNNYFNKSNKSNIIIKDISFFHTKNSTIKNDIQIINVNKKGSTHNNSYIKKKEYNSNSNQKRNNQLKEILNINIKKNKKINQDKYSRSYLDFTYDNYKGALNNSKQGISKSKIAIINKNSNMNNKSFKKRNNSSSKNDKNIYESYLVQKIKIIKNKKKPILSNGNFNLSKNNKTIREKLLNKTGKNIKDSIYHNCNEKYVRNTYRNLFFKKGLNSTNKSSFINLNYNTNYNSNVTNSSLLNNKKKISERNLKIKNINRLTLNPKMNKLNQNKINGRNVIKKTKNIYELNKNIHVNQNKNNKTAKEINVINLQNNINLSSKDNEKKYIDKKEEIIDDFNIKSTKTNDDVFTESKNEKIEESSIEEESGILSMNEIEDIIIYNNMKNINKEDDFLFNKNDYKNFIEENQNKIFSLFFGENNNNINNNKINKQIKVNSDKKTSEINKKQNSNNNNKYKEHKVLSYNNSIKKKKPDFFRK